MLKAIFFDIDDTLYSTSAFARTARLNAVRALHDLGVAIPPDELLRELQEVIHEFGSNYDHHFDKMLRRLPAEALPELNPAVLVASAVLHYHRTKETDLKPFPDVHPLFQALRDAGVWIGVITNGLTIKQAEKLVRLGVIPHLHPNAIFISDQVGISKPNRKLFEKVLAQFDLAPEETMFIGDNPTHDIPAPKELGMITVRIRRGGRHDATDSPVEPSHDITDLHMLGDILRDDYGIALKDTRGQGVSDE